MGPLNFPCLDARYLVMGTNALSCPFKRGRKSSTILLQLDQKKESTPQGVRTLFTHQAMLQRVSSSASQVLA